MLMLILVIVLLFALVGSAPAWPYSANWGYGPSGARTLLMRRGG